MKNLALVLLVAVLICGCGGGPPTQRVVVLISPSNAPNVDQGQAFQFTAAVSGDSSGSGVAWTLSGPGCTGTACGTLTNVTSTSATYHAPAVVSTDLSIMLTATSVAQSTQSAMASFLVVPPPTITTTSLPAATPTFVYHTDLAATGGVQPLTWSVVSGTLPDGMSLNSGGTLFGVPTTGGTTTFTVKVTDSSTSSGGPLSTQQTLTLTVIGVLTIPNALLPDGTVGIAYNTPLPVSGGVPPYSWKVYNGSLPAGLVLQSTGVISGTPTVEGASTFSLNVVDSSPIQQTFTSSDLTITIDPSGPLTIRTTALMDGIVDTPYNGQLEATGGSPPLLWTVTGGALPSGLALDPSTGAIAGLPTASPGTYSFTVQASDTNSPPQTSTRQLAITVHSAATACSSTGNESALVGQYAFSLRGYNGTGFLAVVGSFTADGTGKITAGEADTNGVLGSQNGNLILDASSYSVGPDERGCATFATPFGTFYTRFALGGVSEGVASQGRIIEFDNPGASTFIASGQIFQQSPAAFVSNLTGSYSLRLSGWDPATSGRYACVGVVSGASHKFSYLQQDCNDNGTVTNTVNTGNSSNSLVNTYSASDTNGRGTGILSVGQRTSNFVFYWVSFTRLLVVNSDPAPTFSGDWQQEDVPLGSGFSQGAFRGTVAFYASGLSPAGAGGDVSFATETSDGVNSVTSQLYRDVAGAFQTTSTTCDYTVISIGRVTLSGNNCGANPPIPYLNSLNSAFVIGADPAAELGLFEPLTLDLTDASVAGTYFVGTSEVVSQSAQTEVGVLTLTPGGILTSTLDSASPLGQSVGVANSDTYTLNADGTFTTGSSGANPAGVAVSGSKFVVVSNPSLTVPTLQIGQR